ncbi:MAG: ribonuclease P protein component [Dethiobacteria bacterium]|jgi:ribonuclease P protein component
MDNYKIRDKSFRKSEKLRKNYQFQRVYRNGRSIATKNTVLFIRRNDKEYNRLGVSVSKKVGKSVVRHRLKRLYIEAFRNLKVNIAGNGFDLVIIGRKGAGSMGYKELYNEMKRLLYWGKLLK